MPEFFTATDSTCNLTQFKMYSALYDIEYKKKIAYKIWNQNVWINVERCD